MLLRRLLLALVLLGWLLLGKLLRLKWWLLLLLPWCQRLTHSLTFRRGRSNCFLRRRWHGALRRR